MNESYLTLKQLVELVDIPENSLKRYIQEHEEFIRFDKEHNRYRIHASAVDTLKLIRKLYGEGFKKDAVNAQLKESGVPLTIVVTSEAGGIDLKNLNEELSEVKQMLQIQMQFNQKLVQEFQELKQMVNRKEADEIGSLRKSLELAKKETGEKERKELFAEIDKVADQAVKEALKDYQEFQGTQKKGFFSKFFRS